MKSAEENGLVLYCVWVKKDAAHDSMYSKLVSKCRVPEDVARVLWVFLKDLPRLVPRSLVRAFQPKPCS
jgi:hypothetical protein